MEDWLRVDERRTPSANVVLVATERPVLVDAGVGSARSNERLAGWLAGQGLRPADLTALALTHHHNDHCGGAGWVQASGVPVALHADDRPEDCDRGLLPFAVPPFGVDRTLADGDVIDAGSVQLQVVHVPSQTAGCVAFWEPEARVLISGDLLQAHDVGWVRFDPAADAGALERSIAAVERTAALEPRVVVPGHGPVVSDPEPVIAATLERYRSWRGDPGRPALHACRRILVTQVVLEPAGPEELAATPWAAALARALATTPQAAVAGLVEQLTGSGAIATGPDGRLRARVAHE